MKNVYFICIISLVVTIQFSYSSSKSDSPVQSVIEILTPQDHLMAGDTISVVVKSDSSLYPGHYCFNKVVFQDTLGNGGKSSPIVVSDSGIDTINEFPSETHSTRVYFNDGVDTFKIVLYNASNNNVHKIFIHFDTMLTVYTDPFHLYPGKINSLDIQCANGSSVSDTVTFKAPDDGWMFYAVGFDKYGNRISGWTVCDWSVSGNLLPVSGQNVGQIYYETSSVIIKKSGYLIAASVDSSAPSYVKDSVFIKINGPTINLTRAITRDENGNGYLDHIELRFALPVFLPAGFSFSGLTISYGTTTFTVAGIENNFGRDDSIWSIKINEVDNRTIPQTAWKPFVSFEPNDSLSIAGTTNLQCQDGAGPVVWHVIKDCRSADDRTKDVITVFFSEPVKVADSGSFLSLNNSPSKVFYVWEKRSDDDQPIRDDSILAGINGFSKITKDSIFEFRMLNGVDLTSLYLFNINTGTMYITDNIQGNLPNLNNQRVRVDMSVPCGRDLAITSSTRNGCGCGAGTLLAFIPPIIVKAGNRIKKHLKKKKNK